MKKNNIWKIVLIAVVALITVIVAVLLLKKPANEDGTIVKENVVVFDEKTKQADLPVNVWDDKIVFNKKPRYKEGTVLVSGITEEAPAGFIRKVVSVYEEDGQYIVETEPALLTDVFEEAHINKKFILTDEGAQEVKDEHLYVKAVVDGMGNMACIYPKNCYVLGMAKAKSDEDIVKYKFGTEFEQEIIPGLSIGGEVEVAVWLELQLDISFGNVEFGVIIHDETQGEMTVGIGAGMEETFEKELFEYALPNIQFSIGVVPVVITNTLEIVAEGSVSAEGVLETGFELGCKRATGFYYNSKNGTLKEINEKEDFGEGMTWSTEAKVSGVCSAGVKLHIVTKLYDCTGADIAAGLEAKIEGELALKPEEDMDDITYYGSLDMSIGPVIEGSIVVTVPLIDTKLVDQTIFEVEIPPFWSHHWDSGEDWREQIASLDKPELVNVYRTQYGAQNKGETPIFEFRYPDNWEVVDYDTEVCVYTGTKEDFSIENENGVTITYQLASQETLGLPRASGMGEYRIEKVADAPFITDENGKKFIVAKIILTEEIYIGARYFGEDIIERYAILPTSDDGKEASWITMGDYYDTYLFIQQWGKDESLPCGLVTSRISEISEEEKEEIISILSSFRRVPKEKLQ